NADFFQLHQHVGSIFAVFLFVILFTGVWSLSQARLALWIQFLPFDSTLLPIDTLLQKGENILGIHGFNEVSLPSVEQPTITFCQTMTACSLTLNAQTGEPITVKDAISPLVTLHKSLFIGFPGRIFISLFGFALALLLITGIVIHHRNIKRLFQLRLFQGKKSFFSDLHNLIGLWSYPWLVMFALTGALSGLGALGTVMLAPYAQPEAPSRIMQQLMGESSPARLPLSATSVSELLITLSQEKPEFIPEVLRWQNKGEINQEMMIGGVNISFPSTSNFEQLLFSGLDYHWIAERSSASQQFWTRSFIAVQPLHYGQYKWTGKASFTLTIIHFFMGLAACLLCFSGLILWIFKKPTTF
ncbi:PepSY domain-containing protein, partial [Pseudomonas aeruginosa]|uniref:PepSY-associated TM helix domain-containing protein n=1 Tax=Pseudomonas aeruginosa TaxID=287 RepID=UPI0011C3D2A1